MKNLILLCLLWPVSLWAQGPSGTADWNPVYQEQIREKVKRRVYTGGQDEEDLKVQVQLVRPVRKIGGIAEELDAPSND